MTDGSAATSRSTSQDHPNGVEPQPLQTRDTSTSSYPGAPTYRQPAATTRAPQPAGSQR